MPALLVLLALAAPAAQAAVRDPDGPGFVAVLERAGLYHEAQAEVLRQEQRSGDGTFEGEALFRLGVELAGTGDVASAIQMIEQALALQSRERVADEWHLTLGTLRLKLGDYPVAEGYFSRVEAFTSDPLLRTRAARLACLGHLWALDAEPARRCTPGLLEGSLDAQGKRELHERLDSIAAEQGWRGWVGGSLSAVVPGLGQATAGEPLDGLVALAVNGGWGAGVVLTALTGDIIDASVILLGVLSRYYVGNVEHGAADWTDIADRRRRQAADALMRQIAALPEPRATAAASPR